MLKYLQKKQLVDWHDVLEVPKNSNTAIQIMIRNAKICISILKPPNKKGILLSLLRIISKLSRKVKILTYSSFTHFLIAV